MKLITERHSGTCGHCKTNVPVEADVCTGCGAYWGLSNGKNRQQQYDAFMPVYRMGKFFLVVSVCSIAFTIASPNWKLPAGIISLFALNFTFQYYFKGRTQIKIAKKGQLKWWRKNA